MDPFIYESLLAGSVPSSTLTFHSSAEESYPAPRTTALQLSPKRYIVHATTPSVINTSHATISTPSSSSGHTSTPQSQTSCQNVPHPSLFSSPSAFEEGYNCSTCARPFPRKCYASTVHAKTHYSKAELETVRFPHSECTICGETFFNSSSYMKHLKGHRTLVCKDCGKSYMKASHYSAHLLTHMTPEVRAASMAGWKHSCPLCPNRFQTLYDLKSHKASAHPEPKRFHCPGCQKAFTRKRDMTTHLSVHLKGICKACKKPFSEAKGIEAKLKISEECFRHTQSQTVLHFLRQP